MSTSTAQLRSCTTRPDLQRQPQSCCIANELVGIPRMRQGSERSSGPRWRAPPPHPPAAQFPAQRPTPERNNPSTQAHPLRMTTPPARSVDPYTYPLRLHFSITMSQSSRLEDTLDPSIFGRLRILHRQSPAWFPLPERPYSSQLQRPFLALSLLPVALCSNLGVVSNLAPSAHDFLLSFSALAHFARSIIRR